MMEKNCKWHFANRDKNDQYTGPNNPTKENFVGNRGQINSLMREVIQNSLDARISFDKPVKVKFSFCTLFANSFPELFNLEGTLQACKEFYPDNPQAIKVYDTMLKRLRERKERDAFECLRIEDSGTKGMDYVPVDQDTKHNSKFLAFMRSLGVHSEQENGGGGSFGFGKAAYFGLSPFATVLTSTCSMGDNGVPKYYFEGTSWLSTHYYDVNGVRQYKSGVGYYDNNGGEPVSELDRIPEIFRREEGKTGTTFFILGIDSGDTEDKRSVYDQMFISVLENFWMAILREELEVEIGDGDRRYIVNKDNIEERVNDVIRNGMTFSKGYNPRPLLDAVTSKEKSLHKNYDLKTLGFDDIEGQPYGTLDIYIAKDKEGLNKFQRVRRLLMAVENKNGQTKDGYNGVTVLSEGYGNKLMQMSEPPAHDKWDFTRIETRTPERKAAKQLLEKIAELEQAAVAELFDHASRKVDQVKDIHEYCAIRDERSKREERNGAESGTDISTEKYNEHVDKTKLTCGGKALEKITSQSEPMNGSEPKNGAGFFGGSSHTHNQSSKSGGRKNPGDINRRYKASADGKTRRLYDSKKVKVHCVARKGDDDQYEHEIMVTCTKEPLNDAAIVIKIEGAGGSQDFKIAETSKGKISEAHHNMIEGLNLKKGLNRIKVKFDDPTKKFAISLNIKQ